MFCILVLFGLASVLATFQKIGRFFSKSSGHPALSVGDARKRFIIIGTRSPSNVTSLLYGVTSVTLRHSFNTSSLRCGAVS
jgi:hypothetical protein